MPLIKSSSNEARSENIAREMESKPSDQAIAIGYANQRRMKGKRKHKKHGKRGHKKGGRK